MPLQTGTWSLNSNGSLGQLTISAVDTSGVVTGSLAISGDPPVTISGFWDENSARLSFSAGASAYTGFVSQDQFRMPGITGAVVFMLTGFVQKSVGASADKNIFGWYAEIGVP
jgi:hypothetical protein